MSLYLSLDALRAVASASEEALLVLAHGLACKRDAEGLRLMLSMIEMDGFPGPLTKNNQSVTFTSHGVTRQISLSGSVMECLEDPDTPASLLRCLTKAYQPHSNNVYALLDKLLFEAAEIHRSDLVHTLMDMGASADLAHATPDSSTAQNRSRNITAPIHSLLHGNAEQAIAHIERGGAEVAKHMANAIVKGHSFVGAKGVVHNEANLLVDNLTDSTPSPTVRLLESLEERLGAGEVAPVRTQLLSSYLQWVENHECAWQSPVIEAVMGGRIDCNAVTTLHAGIAGGQVANPFSRPDGKDIWQELVERALSVHCEPVARALLSPLTPSQKPGNHSNLMQAVLESRAAFNSAHMHACVKLLLENGQQLNPVKSPTVITRLAKASKLHAPHVLEKLRVLLEAGGNPQHSAALTESFLANTLREPWMHIVRSFEARKAAGSLLLEIEACDSPKVKGHKA